MKKHIGIIVACLFVYAVLHAEPTVWYVHPDSTLNSIQAALDSCTDNDIVLVAPGTYYENITWPNTQGIHLVSELGRDTTIIDGDSINSVITIATNVDTSTVIRGFTIQNGYTTGNGGGLLCDSSASPTVTNNVIKGNAAYWGGGIHCYYSSPHIIANHVINNTAAYGGGILVRDFSYPSIINNNISSNIAIGAPNSSGGGIFCDNSTRVDIIGDTITNNWCATWGGGICIRRGCIAEIRNNLISGNHTGHGGGILMYSNSNIIGNTIINNTCSASGLGAGIKCSGCMPTIRDNSIIANKVEGGIPGIVGGIFCMFSSPDIRNNIIMENSTGIACMYFSLPTIDSCTISNNFGHGIYFFSYDTVAIFDRGAEIHYCNITGNSYYGIRNNDLACQVNAEYNWWGDSTGPYHPDSNPGGLGDSVSDYVDFIPWLYWPGVEERPEVDPVVKRNSIGATIFAGSLQLPEGKNCKVFDITGRVVAPDKIKPGIYFIEVDGQITRKVVKVR